MDGIVVAVWFQGSHAELLHAVNLKEAARQLLTRSYTLTSQPIKLVLEVQGTSLLYNENLLRQYVQGMLDQEELYKHLLCDGLYRNKVIFFTEGNEIEADCLWMKRAGQVVLVDEDRSYSTGFKPNLFYEVP